VGGNKEDDEDEDVDEKRTAGDPDARRMTP
jgi:hypothetical protein